MSSHNDIIKGAATTGKPIMMVSKPMKCEGQAANAQLTKPLQHGGIIPTLSDTESAGRQPATFVLIPRERTLE
jgi:hypothetical protein